MAGERTLFNTLNEDTSLTAIELELNVMGDNDPGKLDNLEIVIEKKSVRPIKKL